MNFSILVSHSRSELSPVSNDDNNFPSPSIFGDGLNACIISKCHDICVPTIAGSGKCSCVGWIWTCWSFHQSKRRSHNKKKTTEMKLEMLSRHAKHKYYIAHHGEEWKKVQISAPSQEDVCNRMNDDDNN